MNLLNKGFSPLQDNTVFRDKHKRGSIHFIKFLTI